MRVIQEALDQRQVLLTIEMEPREVEPYLQRASRRLAQRLTLPGFRPGKAPRALLERAVGRETLLSEAVDLLIPEVAQQVIAERGLEPSAPPRVEVLGLDPVVLKTTIPLPPLVEVGDYRSLRIPPEPVEVKEEDVERTLENLRREMATWVPVDRPVRQGDLVVLDLEGTIEGRRLLEQREFPYIVDSASPLPLPGFAAHIEGARPGETRSFDLSFPADYPDPNLAGKPCLFTVSIKDVKERHLPDLSDELARGLGQPSLEALREDIRRRLREAREREERRRYQDQVVKALQEQSRVELPPLLVEREVDHLLEEEARALARQGLSLEDHLRRLGKDLDQHREDLRPRAQERLIRSALLLKVADLEGLEADPEEIRQFTEEVSTEKPEEREAWRRFWEEPSNHQALLRALRRRKALECLVAIARGEAPPSGLQEGTP